MLAPVDAPEERKLRSDARRNRAAMIKAARKVFAQHGVDAPLDLVARTAGVGRATQHRHFPTREKLLSAIFEDNFDQIAEIGAQAAPEEAYAKMLLETIAILFRDRGFMELMDHRVPEEAQHEMARRFIELMTPPLRRAQKAGLVRGDLRPEDTMLLVDMLAGAAQPPGRRRQEYRMDRALHIVLEAIEPEGEPRPPLAVPRSLVR